MASPETPFERVLRQFKSGLSEDERQDFTGTSLRDLKEAIVLIQKRQSSSRTMQNMPRIKRFLEAMETYSTVLDTFVNVNDFVAFIWGPVKFLLQVTSTFAEAFNTLLNAYQRIAECIPVLADYQALFQTNSAMSECLQMIFADIFEFHRRALKYFKGSVWKQLFQATWKTFNTKFEDQLNNMTHHKNLIESRASLIEYEEAKHARALAAKQFELLQEQDKVWRRKHTMNWLSAVSVSADQEKWKSARKENVEAGRWLMRKEKIRGWLDTRSTAPPLLWVNGKPGAGKTVLASLLVEEISKPTTRTVVYFYLRNNDPQRDTFVAMCRSLLHQLLLIRPTLAPYLFEASVSSGESSLTTQRLATELLFTCLKAVGNVYMVIDGLDECTLLEQKHIALTLRKAIDSTVSEPQPCRCIFLSQDDGAIRSLLSKIPDMKISDTDNWSDIEVFSRRRAQEIQARFQLPDGRKSDIVQMVTKGAQGMFLYAKLVLDNLFAQSSVYKLEQEMAPETFPQGIEGAYDRIMERIRSQAGPAHQHESERLLAWVTCAVRPLRWREIQAAVAIDGQCQTVDMENRRWVDGAKDLCGSLVEEGQDGEITLVHSTARTYLQNKDIVLAPIENLRLAEMCLEYLSFPMFDSDIADNQVDANIKSGCYGFLDYASMYWPEHMTLALEQTCAEKLYDDFQETLEGYLGQRWIPDQRKCKVPKEAISLVKKLSQATIHEQVLDILASMHAAMLPDVVDIDPFMVIDTFRVLFRIRGRIEILANDQSSSYDLERHYGQYLFKCPRLSCKQFYNGFETRQQRDAHRQRHERPHVCAHSGCIGNVGFATRSELARHNATYHKSQPTDKDFPSDSKGNRAEGHAGAQIGQKRAGDFICRMCSMSFTKASNMRSHEKLHSNVRPFACEQCRKAFARAIDLTRHERTCGSKSSRHPCGGEIFGKQWGCGNTFARVDGLARHLRSEAGLACKQAREQASAQMSAAPYSGYAGAAFKWKQANANGEVGVARQG